MQYSVYLPVKHALSQAKNSGYVGEGRFESRRGTVCSSTRLGIFLYETH